MGNSYCLANFSKKEYVRFLDGSKEGEIMLNEQAKIVAFYVFNNNGDCVCFIGDEWNVGTPFDFIKMDEIASSKEWKDVTEEINKEFEEYKIMWNHA